MDEKKFEDVLWRGLARFDTKILTPRLQKIEGEIQRMRGEMKQMGDGLREDLASKVELEIFRRETERNFADLRGGLIQGVSFR